MDFEDLESDFNNIQNAISSYANTQSDMYLDCLNKHHNIGYDVAVNLLEKSLQQSISFRRIFEKTFIKNNDITSSDSDFIDFYSLCCITRSIYELMAIYFYIFSFVINKKEENYNQELDFKLKSYEHYSLENFYRFKKTNLPIDVVVPITRKQKNSFWNEITKHPFMDFVRSNFDKQTINNFESKKVWMLYSYPEIFSSIGVIKKIECAYHLLSDISHSGKIGLYILNSEDFNEENSEFKLFLYRLTMFLTANVFSSYTNYLRLSFKEIPSIPSDQSYIFETVNKWTNEYRIDERKIPFIKDRIPINTIGS